MAVTAKGSIVLKLVILVLAFLLLAVIYVPDKLWDEEETMTRQSRFNMTAIFEAERFYYTSHKSYISSDSLEKLVEYVRSDSSLQARQKVGKLTNQLYDQINRIMEVPIASAFLPILQSVDEINGDLSFNTRYFRKYDTGNLLIQKDEIMHDLLAWESSSDFPNFVRAKTYADSLSQLRERMNEYTLQNASLHAQRYLDSLLISVQQLEANNELAAVNAFWDDEYQKILGFIKDIKRTDVVKVSSVADRLKKFIDRINSALKTLDQADLQQNIAELEQERAALENLRTTFLRPDNFMLTQSYGLLQLNETDSILVTFTEENLTCPDTLDGIQRYIVAFKEGSADLTVECPNLLNRLHEQLVSLTSPLQQLSLYDHGAKIRASLDSTLAFMEDIKRRYKLNKYQDILLEMKEIDADFHQGLDKVLLYRYITDLKNFVDTVQTEKKLSVLKPLIEDILNPMDTLAARIERGDLHDLEEKLNQFGQRIQKLDSIVAAAPIPARIKRQIPQFYPQYEQVFSVVEEMKASFDPREAQVLSEARPQIEQALLDALNGYSQRRYVIFAQKHINHGYIHNGEKSWEATE